GHEDGAGEVSGNGREDEGDDEKNGEELEEDTNDTREKEEQNSVPTDAAAHETNGERQNQTSEDDTRALSIQRLFDLLYLSHALTPSPSFSSAPNEEIDPLNTILARVEEMNLTDQGSRKLFEENCVEFCVAWVRLYSTIYNKQHRLYLHFDYFPSPDRPPAP
ncbi:MAG: hypothetical protein Q9174_007248, partial [Haloplaca sp. 1 TL-2023]